MTSPDTHAVSERFANAVQAVRIRANEAAIDDALFNLARVREQLVGLDLNTAACRCDEAIEAIEDECRKVFGRRGL
jgi:hypothetical protein